MQEITINSGDVVYIMHSTNKGIQICSECREEARKQLSGGKKRGGIPKGHDLGKFSDETYLWWLEEEFRGSEKARGYMGGCLACKKLIKVQKAK